MTLLSYAKRQMWLQSRVPVSAHEAGKAEFFRLYLRARALARVGDLDLAIPLYQKAIDLEPTLDEALEGLGEALDILGQTELAMEKYAAARRVRAAARPGAPDRHFVLRQRGHFAAEVLAYDAVVRSLKKNALPYIARGNAYLASGRPGEALKNYNRALKLKRDLPAVAALKGEALSKLGLYEEAVQSFDAALKLRPDDAEALGGRAIARIGLGLLDEANDDWRLQFQLMEGHAAARACIALRLADWAMALPELEQALEKEPNDPYWSLYRLIARRRLHMAADAASIPTMETWPGPLLALHAGELKPADVVKRADTDDRRAEALFLLGVLVFDRELEATEAYWKDVLGHSSPSLIEHAAARNELARFAS